MYNGVNNDCMEYKNKNRAILVYKNSGDSIITLQKQETQAVKFINYELTNSRLNKAKVKYIKAVCEKTENKLAKIVSTSASFPYRIYLWT